MLRVYFLSYYNISGIQRFTKVSESIDFSHHSRWEISQEYAEVQGGRSPMRHGRK